MAGHDPHAGRYETRLQGQLQTCWAAWFDGMTVSNVRNDTTLRGSVVDQAAAALHGLLRKLQHLGLPLLSVTTVGPNQPEVPNTDIR